MNREFELGQVNIYTNVQSEGASATIWLGGWKEAINKNYKSSEFDKTHPRGTYFDGGGLRVVAEEAMRVRGCGGKGEE